jgi:hypothetical protein
MVGLNFKNMKQLLLVILLCLSIDVIGQTILKDKKQELRIERVIQNSEGTYKIYFHATYLVVGNRAMMDLFLEELLVTISNQKTVNTYVGNTLVTYLYVDESVIVKSRGTNFILTRKQIGKLKKRIV